jgi:hypothetical protein
MLLPAQAARAVADVTRLEVRIVTGEDGASAGSAVELRIREAGKPERRLPLGAGEAWPKGSTRVIPLALSPPLDPEAVARVGLWFRGPAGPPDAWSVASAEVYALRGRERIRLLNATIEGVLRREGELSTAERATSTLTCITDAECSDGRSCNGAERCQPGARGADARGCVRGTPLQCPTNEVCIEGQGCRGVGAGAGGGLAIGGRAANASPAAAVRDATPAVQTCSGADVLLTDAGGSSRLEKCPSGTTCIPQPNGTGVCARN